MFVIAMENEKALLPSDADYIVTGVGGTNVIRSLSHLDKDTEIINVGYAGSNMIPIGKTVRIGSVSLYHPSVDYKEPKYMLDGDTPCMTSCDFVLQTDIDYPCVFDMELAFILAMGFTNVKAEKVISDNLSLKEFETYGETKN